jgi:hypothetical protein
MTFRQRSGPSGYASSPTGSSSSCSEPTIFMQDIVPGKDFAAPTREAFTRVKAGDHSASDRLNDILDRASTAVRDVYHGLLTYASLVWEDVNWDRFDLVGVDHYRDARIKDRYAEMLQPLLALGKPVINTEFGMRTYRGAESDGTLGFGVGDDHRSVLPSPPRRLRWRHDHASRRSGMYLA